MITVRFGKEGIPYSDFECEVVLLSAEKSNEDVLFFTSTENLVTAARCLKAEGRLPELRIEHADMHEVSDLQVDSDGRLPHWPNGFCGHIDDWLHRLLKSHF